MDERPLLERVRSRRFLLTLLVSVVVVIGEKFGVSLDGEELLALAGIVGAYNLKDLAARAK